MASAQSSSTSTAGQEEPSPTQQAVVVPPPLSKRPFLIYIMLRGYVDLERKKLRKGAIEDVAHKLGIKSSAVQRQWRKYKESILEPEAHPLPDFTRKEGSGGHVKFSSDEIRRRVNEIPQSDRLDYRTLEAKTGISKSTLHKAAKNGLIPRTISSIKPIYSESNEADKRG